MQRLSATATVVLCLLGVLGMSLGAPCARAQAGDPVEYVLDAESAFTAGCFGPCDCPVTLRPMSGRFVRTHAGDGPLYTTYALRDVDWRVGGGTAIRHLTGSGEYRIGGEFALQHRLVLDLSIDGGPVQHFDSGWIAGGGGFPRIDADAAEHGFACYDTVLEVRASPSTPSALEPGDAAAALVVAGPNPFRGEVRIDVVLAAPGKIDLAVYDVGGRIVRRLAYGLSLPAGRRSVGWDGQRGDGAAAAAGVYIVRLVSGDRSLSHRVVKLR